MSKELEAKTVYQTLCKTLDNMKWHYDPEPENFLIRTSAVGDDLSMKLFMKVDVDRSVMYLKSPMPFAVPAEKRNIMCEAVTIANWAMLNGSFEMDLADGYLGFKVVLPFMESLLSEKACRYMINMSCQMVDLFNDKLQSVSNGTMTLREFNAFAEKAFS